MKKVLFLLSIALFAFSCDKDDDLTADLFHDRGENDAPFLDPGEYITAARFTATDLNSFQGRTLESVEYYLVNTPTQAEVRVYTGSDNGEPETLVYSQTVTTEMRPNEWNMHDLSTPVNVDGQDLWLCVRIVHNSREKTVGCDVGPAVSNGDWFVSFADNEWKSFREFTNQEVNINWNIRGHVSD